MRELDRQVQEYKDRCDRGEQVSRADAIWLLNELIYERDQPSVPQDAAPRVSPQGKTEDI
jgi:hypothetical protein